MKFAFEFAIAAENRREELLNHAMKNAIKNIEEVLEDAVNHGLYGSKIDFYKTDFTDKYSHLAVSLVQRIIGYLKSYGFTVKSIDSLSFLVLFDDPSEENE